MTLRLVQLSVGRQRSLVAIDATSAAQRVDRFHTTYELALTAIRLGKSLSSLVSEHLTDQRVDLQAAIRHGQLLPPIDHPDNAHLYLTGTGLTHLGSAEGRDKMHRSQTTTVTDSMRMFKMGVDGGKPAPGVTGVQPEWFYKGDGSCIVAPEAAIPSPDFALDGSEEPEIAGVYVVDEQGWPHRLGFCLANEFSDHVIERGNYLWLAHSKLRPASLGAELLVGELPSDVRGMSRIFRNGELLWEKPFWTGEANMSHAISNLEHHHFKYPLFRRPGDVHVHCFGTATLSFTDGVKTQAGDVFEISAPPFSLALRNTLQTVSTTATTEPVHVL